MNKLPFLLAALMAASVGAAPIQKGDHVFLYGRLICWNEVRAIEGAIVSDSGEATFLGEITIKVDGLEPIEVAAGLADALEDMSGKRPKTLEVLV